MFANLLSVRDKWSVWPLLTSLVVSIERMADWWVLKSILILEIRFSRSTFEVVLAYLVVNDVRMFVLDVFPHKFLAAETLLAYFTRVLFVLLLTYAVFNAKLRLKLLKNRVLLWILDLLDSLLDNHLSCLYVVELKVVSLGILLLKFRLLQIYSFYSLVSVRTQTQSVLIFTLCASVE